MKLDDKDKDYLRKLHLETQIFMEKGLFAVSSASIPLICIASRHLTAKTHMLAISISLFLAACCFIITLISQFISFRLSKKLYERTYKRATEKLIKVPDSEKPAKNPYSRIDRIKKLKTFYHYIFGLGLFFILCTIFFHTFF